MKKYNIILLASLLLISQSLFSQQNWDTDGNSTSQTDFLGTTNTRRLLFKTDDKPAMVIEPNGRTGIGKIYADYSPLGLLEVGGPNEETYFTINRKYWNENLSCLFNAPWHIINKTPSQNNLLCSNTSGSRLNFEFYNNDPVLSLTYRKLGIREENPENILTVNSDQDPLGGGGVRLKRVNNSAQALFGIDASSGNKGLHFYMSSSGTNTNFQSTLFLKQNRDIGVGTDNPEGKLHINQLKEQTKALILEFDETSSTSSHHSDILFKDNDLEDSQNWIIRSYGMNQTGTDASTLRFWNPSVSGKVNFLGNVFEDISLGIGTNNPNASTHIVQKEGRSEAINIEFNSNDVIQDKYSDLVFTDPDLEENKENWIVRSIGTQHASSNKGAFQIISPEKTGQIHLLGSNDKNIRLGIGTTSPSGSIEIHQDQNIKRALVVKFHENNTSAGKYSDIVFLDPDLSGTQRNWLIRSHGTQQSSDPGLLQFTSSEKPGEVFFGGNGGIKVGIGTKNFVGNHSFYVKGSIVAEEIFVKLESNWPDYVFEPNYNLKSIDELEKYIKTKKRLPGIQSANEIKERGLPTGEIVTKQMEKIEELTLYIIEMNKRLRKLENDNQELQKLILESNK